MPRKTNEERRKAAREYARKHYAANAQRYKDGQKRRYRADKEAQKQRVREWRAAHPDLVPQFHRKRVFEKYGMTLQDFERMWAQQQGKCAICKTPMKSPHIDHNHQTNKIRGLLCRLCNSFIGFARDSPEILRAGAAYVEQDGDTGERNDQLERQQR